MKKATLTIFFILAAEVFSYPFTVPYFDEEFFLYPFLNYDQSPEWKKTREGSLYSGGMVQMSYGSLTTYDLMNNVEAVINRDIGDDFTFRFRYRDHQVRHLSYNESSMTTGLGYKINGNFQLTAETALPYEKADIDLKPGLLFTFQTVYAYAGVNFNDILFSTKNIGGGVNNKTPVTFTTDIRFSFSRLYFFISGNYGTGIDRTWTENAFTDVLAHKNHIRNLYARIEYDLTDYLKVYSENYWDDFYDEKCFLDSTLDISEYKFSAKLSMNRIGSVFCLKEKHIVEAGASYAKLDHDFDLIDGNSLNPDYPVSYVIEYDALLPYIIYKYRIHSRFTAEASYMGCCTVNESKNNIYFVEYGEKYWDKELLKLGIEYRFSPNSSLYISAGQLINTGVFGGGNARFNLFF